MRELFNYFFYRIEEFYVKFGRPESTYLYNGRVIFFGSINAIILLISHVLLVSLLNCKVTDIIVIAELSILFFFELYFPRKKRTFTELEKKYKNEKNKRFKGWLIVAFLSGSWIIAAMITAIMI